MHPFARFIQMLGKGRNGMHPLSQAEAYEAMQMIACYDLYHFRAVWDGEVEDHYGELAVTGTLALVIRAPGIVNGAQEAQRMAMAWWWQRHVGDWAQEAV